jgi:hypothetical protein
MECWFVVVNVQLPQPIGVQAIFQDPLLQGCPLKHAIGARGMSRDSIVGVVTGHGLDNGGVKNFLHVVQTGCGVHPTSHSMGTGVKVAWREADHSTPASAEVNKMWIYTSTPPYAFMA